MKEIVFIAKPREIIGKQVKALRREGRLPAVLYGHSIEPITVTLDMRNASRVLPTLTSSHLVVVDVDGDRHTALVREKQRDPLSGGLLHVDFQVVSLTETLRATVPVMLIGESPAVKELNGVLVLGQEQLEVQCLPGDLPERIEVNISGLTEIGSALHVRDIKLSAAVEILTDLDEMLVVVTPPAAEEAPGAEAGAAEPEVVERGKKEEDF